MAKIKIIAIDDDPISLKIVTSFLQGDDFDVTTAVDLATAQQALRNQRFDVVLLDLKLPDGEGAAMVRQVNAEARSAAIVIITASEDDDTFFSCIEEKVDGYLVKPVNDRKKLVRAIWLAYQNAEERQMGLSSLKIHELEAKMEILKRLSHPGG